MQDNDFKCLVLAALTVILEKTAHDPETSIFMNRCKEYYRQNMPNRDFWEEQL